MRLNRWMTALQGAVLAFLISFGAMSALVTAFSLSLDRPWALWAVCAGVALFSGLILCFRHGGTVLLILGALAAWYLRGQQAALEQLLRLIYRISYVYNGAYHTGYLQLIGGVWNEGFGDWPVCIWGGIIAAVTAISVGRGWAASAPLLLAAVPLAACFVVTDTVPAPWSLILLIYGAVLLIFTARLRRSNPAQGNRLMFLCAGPVALALGVLMLAVPQKDYVNQSAQVRQSLAQWFQEAPRTLDSIELPEPLLNFYIEESERVNLNTIGPWNNSSLPVLYVQADVGGTLYLRGQDYDEYNGLSWTPTHHRAESFSCPGERLGNVSIETVDRLRRMYLPYYPDGEISLVGGTLENTGLYQQYHFTRTGLPGDLYTLLDSSTLEQRTPQEQYLALPKKSRERLAQIAQPLVQGADSATRKAERIGAYVRSCARYDKQTPSMDSGAEDFALWFLEKSDRGYCVHFATAAVTLLRSVGVEARYVSGYMVWAQPGERTVVTGEHAHAWAEYFEPKLNLWLPLEATPSGGQPVRQQQPEPSPTLPAPAPTQPPQAPQPQTPSQAPSPEQPNPPEPTESAKFQPTAFSQRLTTVLKAVLSLALIWAMLRLQRRLRMELRRLGQRRGTPNAQALARWREVELLAGLCRRKPPEELKELAQKAKFSQYTLTAEELLVFDGAIWKARRSLSRENLLKRMIYQYIFAVL